MTLWYPKWQGFGFKGQRSTLGLGLAAIWRGFELLWVPSSSATCSWSVLTELRHRAVKKPTSSTQRDSDENTTSTETGACCGCPKTAQQLETEEQERLYQTEFENFLLSSLYHRKWVALCFLSWREGWSSGKMADCDARGREFKSWSVQKLNK